MPLLNSKMIAFTSTASIIPFSYRANNFFMPTAVQLKIILNCLKGKIFLVVGKDIGEGIPGIVAYYKG